MNDIELLQAIGQKFIDHQMILAAVPPVDKYISVDHLLNHIEALPRHELDYINHQWDSIVYALVCLDSGKFEVPTTGALWNDLASYQAGEAMFISARNAILKQRIRERSPHR